MAMNLPPIPPNQIGENYPWRDWLARLRMTVNSTANPSSGVSEIVAGTNITIIPSSGTGKVTINSSGAAGPIGATGRDGHIGLDGQDGEDGLSIPGINGTNSIGEILTATAAPAAVSLTTATAATVISVALTAGVWDVTGVVNYTPDTTTSISVTGQGINSVTNTLGAQDSYAQDANAAEVPGAIVITKIAPVVRVNISVGATYYLVARATFTISTLTAGGTIRAERVS
jgi:hypothetical protein